MGRLIEGIKNIFAGITNNGNASISNTTIVNSNVVQVAGDYHAMNPDSMDIDLPAAKISDALSSKDDKLLNKLVEEKLDQCKRSFALDDIAFLEGNLEIFTDETLARVVSASKDRIEFYRVLLRIYKEVVLLQDSTREVDFILSHNNIFEADIQFINDLIKSTRWISYEEIIERNTETQAIAVFILYNKNSYSNIIKIYEQHRQLSNNGKEENRVRDDISITFEYYYGLCKYNEGDYESASKALKSILSLAEINDQNKIYLIKIIALASDIEGIIGVMLNDAGISLNKDRLKCVYDEYIKLLNNKPDGYKKVKSNESIFEAIRLQTILVLYPEDFLYEYNKADVEIKDSDNVKLVLANYYELNQNYQAAKNVYKDLTWNSEGRILGRLSVSLLMLQEYDEIINIHEKCSSDVKTAEFIGVYLAALREKYKTETGNCSEYYDELTWSIEKYKNSADDLFKVLLCISCTEDFEKYAIDVIRGNMDDIRVSPDLLKAQYSGLLLGFGYGTEASEILHYINNAQCISERWAEEFFKDLFFYVGKEVPNVATDHDKVYVAESIAEWFISNNLFEIEFLKFIANKIYDQNRFNLTLAYSERLFDAIRKKGLDDESVLINIVGIVVNNKLKKPDRWNEYLDELKRKTDTEAMFALAIAYEYEGQYSQADFFKYKAIFRHNGKEDISFCMRLLSSLQSGIARHSDETEILTIHESAVVTLKRKSDGNVNTTDENASLIQICLDGEPELNIKDNWSLGIKHYGVSTPIYQKLQNCKKNEEVCVDGERFIIEEIVDRYSAMHRYLFNKLISFSDNTSADESVEPFFKPIYGIDVDDFKKQFIAFEHSEERLAAKEALNNRFELYFSDGVSLAVGIPIDTISVGNYDDYFGVIGELLYKRDYAFRAGHLIMEEKTFEGKIVVSLSSFVALAHMSLLYLLEPLVDKIILPESLLDFVKSRINKSGDDKTSSPGSIRTTENDEIFFVENDNYELKCWNDIYELCGKCEVYSVSQEDRIKYRIIGDTVAESLFASLKLHICQLDTFITAFRNNAVMICDDIFLRYLMSVSGIKNTNLSTLIYTLDNQEQMEHVALELSKTNYIYTPIICHDYESMNQLWTNLMDGERKKKAYTNMILQYRYWKASIDDNEE